VTVSGVAASYFFLEGTSMMPSSPTVSSAKRALTTSFGSICYGSLIVAILKTIRYLLRQAAQENSAMAAFANCILGCIEGLVEFFNQYAFVHVAIYGKSFCDSAKDTWKMVKESGIDAIINDNLVGTVLGMGCLAVGAVAGTVTYGIGYGFLRGVSVDTSVAWGYLVAIAIAAFFLGFLMMSVVTMVVESGTQTVFVCLAENPSALARSKPELYEKFKQVYPQLAWRV
jgi:hypothetical protein